MKDNGFTHRPSKKLHKEQYHAKEGAWKLAYADFVTAMMCFFMLMWLLNATPSQKLKSMATYFKPTIGFFSQSSKEEQAESSSTKNQKNEVNEKASSTSSQVLANIESKFKSDIANNAYMKDLATNISTSMNSDGLEISIFDNNKNPMFKKHGTELTDDAKAIVEKISRLILYIPNRVVIGGYTEKTDTMSISGINGWDLSAGRASSAMKTMQISGLPQERIAKLVSYSDNIPFDENDPYSPRNRRITITLLTTSSSVQYKIPISKSAISLDNK